MSEPFGLVGLGGYAGYVGRFLLERMKVEGKPLRLAAVYEPEVAKHAELAEAMKAAGVELCSSYAELLTRVKAVWLPIPIDLHRRMTEEALAAGVPVLVEKPAAGCVQDIDAMIRARDAAKLPVAVGFQDIYAESTQSLKQQIVDGAFGRISGGTLYAMWPRDSVYYERPWAGKLRHSEGWVLDSPANNALAHFVHLGLYLLGKTRAENAVPVSVEAELYRVNPIENYDTCCMRIEVEGGEKLLVCLTHASEEMQDPILQLDGQAGDRIVYDYGKKLGTVRWGGFDVPMTLTPNTYEETLTGFEGLMKGDKGAVHASLEMARTHGAVISGASQAAKIHTIEPPHRAEKPLESGAVLRHIPKIGDLFRKAAATRKMLNELSAAPWTKPAAKISLRGYGEFTGPA